MNTTSKILIGILIVVLVVFGVYMLTHRQATAGAFSQSSSVSSQTGLALKYTTNPVDPNGGLNENGLNQIVTSGTFGPANNYSIQNGNPVTTSYQGSTTLFAIQNPFSATSTLVFSEIYGTNAAASTTLMVGTSTQATGISYNGPNGNNISPSLISTNSLATSSLFAYTSGAIADTRSNQYPGSASQVEILVGPSEYVVGFATSSSVGAFNTAQYAIVSATSTLAGTYSFEWYR